MHETGFGEGGYLRSGAITPAAPVLNRNSSVSMLVSIGSDLNPDWSEYAIENMTDAVYLDAAGGASVLAVWRTADDWGTVTASGLSASTSYSFRVRARNASLVETDWGPSAELSTDGLAVVEASLLFEVEKASSTISAPSFMSGLGTSIRIAGKDLNDFGFHVDRIGGLDMPGIDGEEILVPGEHSWQFQDEYFAVKHVVLEGYVHGTSVADLRLRLACLKSFIATFEGDPWRSTAPVRLERGDLDDRHWLVYYESAAEIETLGRRDSATSARIRIGMKCATPFALSNSLVRRTFTPVAGAFMPIELGNAPSDAVYIVEGAATDPCFTVGDMVFLCDFAEGLAYSDVENNALTGVFTPSTSEAAAWMSCKHGMGMLVTGSNTISFTATGNAEDFAWIVVVTPQWHSHDQSSDLVLLEHYADADNYIRLWWDGSEGCWVFRKRAAGVSLDLPSSPQAFLAGTTMVLGITFDSTNAGGMKLYIDGVQDAVNADVSALSAGPDSLSPHDHAGTMQPDTLFEIIAGWSRMLSADEMLRIATDPETVSNRNRRVAWSGTLDSGDLLTLASSRKTAEIFDVSENTRANALDGVSGAIPALIPGRQRTATDRTQTMIYTKTSAASMEVKYRRRHL